MIDNRWSLDNIAFGMGGGLLQKVNRDTQRFAFKCSSVTIDGTQEDVQKTVKSDTTKASKPGKLILLKRGYGKYQTIKEDWCVNGTDELKTVFLNGNTIGEQTLGNIIARAAERELVTT